MTNRAACVRKCLLLSSRDCWARSLSEQEPMKLACTVDVVYEDDHEKGILQSNDETMKGDDQRGFNAREHG